MKIFGKDKRGHWSSDVLIPLILIIALIGVVALALVRIFSSTS
jgi:hypothetical protein